MVFAITGATEDHRRNGFGPLDDEAEPSDDGEERMLAACSEVELPPRRPILLDSYRHDDATSSSTFGTCRHGRHGRRRRRRGRPRRRLD